MCTPLDRGTNVTPGFNSTEYCAEEIDDQATCRIFGVLVSHRSKPGCEKVIWGKTPTCLPSRVNRFGYALQDRGNGAWEGTNMPGKTNAP